jgi:prolyl oligopeptidase PreP (S9A serine peptidase family)
MLAANEYGAEAPETGMKHGSITLALGWALASSLTAQEAHPTPAQVAASEDPYQWLEGVTDEKALTWVKERNAASAKELTTAPAFGQLEGDILKILDSTARIPYVSKHGAYFYNFWKDAKNPKGLWRRTTLAEYRKAEPKWDVILDLDALAKSENESWVWHGTQILKAGGYRHVLINLSRGGADASICREFDLKTRRFFDASGLEVSQHFATSKDGTRVPYFQVSPKDLTKYICNLDHGLHGFTRIKIGLELKIPWKMRKPPGVGTGPTKNGVLVGRVP